ncbi:MAG: hypothetical protein EZS28_052154, partial [Streblomastix strix]
KLRKGMTIADKCATEDEIRRADPSIRHVDAMARVLGLTDHKTRRFVYHLGFPNSLLQDLYETKLRITKEGNITQEKFVENADKYEEKLHPDVIVKIHVKNQSADCVKLISNCVELWNTKIHDYYF